MKYSSAFVLLFGFLSLCPAQGDPLTSFPSDVQSSMEFSRDEMELVNLTNAVRVKHHLPPLTMNSQLTNVARKQSTNMAKRHHLSHFVKGKSLKKRVKKSGYRYKRIAENIARSRRSFSHVIQMWMHSPLHRKNMLSPKYKDVGVGIVQAKNGDRYFTQVFGRPKKKSDTD